MDRSILDEFRGCLERLISNSNKEERSEVFQKFQLSYKSEHEEHPLRGQYVKQDEKLVVPFFLAERPKGTQFESNGDVTRKESESSAHDLSIEGAPLELQDYGLDESELQEKERHLVSKYWPVSVQEARYLLSLYNLLTNENMRGEKSSFPPLYVLCDGRKDGTASLGVHPTCFNNNIGKRILKLSIYEPETEISSLSNRVKEIRRGQATPDTVDMYAEYEVIGSKDSESGCKVMVSVSWQDWGRIPTRRSDDARAIVHVKLSDGDANLVVKSLRNELVTLQDYAGGLASGNAYWPTQRNNVSLLDTVKEFIQELKSVTAVEESEKESLTDDDFSSVSHTVIKPRTDLDFIDKLWNILKDCSSFQELTECLEFVLACLKQGNFFPMVHQESRSGLAQLVQDAYVYKLNVPALEGLLPLQMLVQIGIDKLQKDYENALLGFGGKQFLHSLRLEYYVASGVDVAEQVARLEKLDYCLQTLAILKSYLELPTPHLYLAARDMLEYFQKNPLDSEHIFKLSVKAKDIAGTLDRFKPSIWKAEIHTTLHGSTACDVFQLTTRWPLEHISPRRPNKGVAREEEEEEKESVLEEEEDWAYYYFFSVTESLARIPGKKI